MIGCLIGRNKLLVIIFSIIFVEFKSGLIYFLECFVPSHKKVRGGGGGVYSVLTYSKAKCEIGHDNICGLAQLLHTFEVIGYFSNSGKIQSRSSRKVNFCFLRISKPSLKRLSHQQT